MNSPKNKLYRNYWNNLGQWIKYKDSKDRKLREFVKRKFEQAKTAYKVSLEIIE